MTADHSKSKSRCGVIYQVMQRDVDLSLYGSRLTHYHTHPRGAFEHLHRLIEHQVNSAEFILCQSFPRKVYQHEIRSYLGTIIGLPSEADIRSYLSIISRNPTTQIDFVIISPLGYTLIILDVNRIISESNKISADILAQQYGYFIEKIPGFIEYLKSKGASRKYFEQIDQRISSEVGLWLTVINITRVVRETMDSSSWTYFEQCNASGQPYSPNAHIRHMIKSSVDELLPLLGQHDAIHLVHRSVQLVQREGKLMLAELQKR